MVLFSNPFDSDDSEEENDENVEDKANKPPSPSKKRKIVEVSMIDIISCNLDCLICVRSMMRRRVKKKTMVSDDFGP